MNLAALLFDVARRQPEAPAVSNSVHAWSYREFAHRVSCLAGGLSAHGLVRKIGEVVTKSDCVMAGYWENPEASTEILRSGWLHTGDLGSFDEDGFLTLRDRAKDMIISGGSNIYPREIEEVLLRRRDVVEASVVGRPHAEWGEKVVALCRAAARNRNRQRGSRPAVPRSHRPLQAARATTVLSTGCPRTITARC